MNISYLNISSSLVYYNTLIDGWDLCCSTYCFVYHCLSIFSFGNHIRGVLVSVLVLVAVDRGFEPKIGICCFSPKYAALRRKNKDWLALVRIMCPSRATCLFTDWCFIELAPKIQLRVLV